MEEFKDEDITSMRGKMAKETEDIDALYRRIQVLKSQVSAYRKRLNAIEPCLPLGTRPCPDCHKPLIAYCPRCDR